MKLAVLIALLNAGYSCATAPLAPVAVSASALEKEVSGGECKEDSGISSHDEAFLDAAHYAERFILGASMEYTAAFEIVTPTGEERNGFFFLKRGKYRGEPAILFSTGFSNKKTGVQAAREEFVYVPCSDYDLAAIIVDGYENGRLEVVKEGDVYRSIFLHNGASSTEQFSEESMRAFNEHFSFMLKRFVQVYKENTSLKL